MQLAFIKDIQKKISLALQNILASSTNSIYKARRLSNIKFLEQEVQIAENNIKILERRIEEIQDKIKEFEDLLGR